jgi:hypothetical protein
MYYSSGAHGFHAGLYRPMEPTLRRGNARHSSSNNFRSVHATIYGKRHPVQGSEGLGV